MKKISSVEFTEHANEYRAIIFDGVERIAFFTSDCKKHLYKTAKVYFRLNTGCEPIALELNPDLNNGIYEVWH